MASIVNKVTGQKEEQDPNQQPISGAGSSALGANPSAPTQKQMSPGRFTNIQQYLGANTGAGQKLAGQIGQGVEKSRKDVEKSLEATSSVRDQIQAEKDRIAQASGFAQQVGQDPTQLVPMSRTQWEQSSRNPNRLTAQPVDPNSPGRYDTLDSAGFTSKGTGNLSIPQTYEDYLAQTQPTFNAFTQLRTGQTAAGNIQQAGQQALDTAQGKLATLQEQSRLAGTEPGRFQLLQQNLGRPSYTKGQQRLDQLLVQTSGGGVLDALQKQAALKAQQATGAIAGTEKDLGQGVQDITTGGKAAQEQLMKALGALGAQKDDPNTPDIDESKGAGAFGSLQDALRTRQQQFINEQKNVLTDINKGLADTTAQKAYADLQQQKQYLDGGKWVQDRFNQEKAAHGELSDLLIMNQFVNPALAAYKKELDYKIANTPDPGINLYQDQFTQAALDKLGLKAGQNLYDINLADAIRASFSPDMVTEQSVATDQDLAKYQALAKLAGTDLSYLNRNQLNTAPGVEINKSNFDQAFAAGKNRYNDFLKTVTGLVPQFSDPQIQAAYQKQYGDKAYEEMAKRYVSGAGSLYNMNQDWLNKYKQLTGRTVKLRGES